MRKINSSFQTEYISQEGQKLSNRDYFGYVELDQYACYVVSDSLDEDEIFHSAKLVVESCIRYFIEKPSMSKSFLKRLVKKADQELKQQKGCSNLKATVLIVVTDYQKIRYCCVGNSRFYLLRNDRFFERSKDQSLAQTLLEDEKIILDQVARHEERNNLYSYLGDQGHPVPDISKKIKLVNGDVFSIATRGIWERCEETEFLEIHKEAKEPKDILEKIEDSILSKQEQEQIDNYTLVVTFVQKIYESSKKKLSIKQILMITIPILILFSGIATGWYFYNRSIKNKEIKLKNHMESGENYFQYDNYKKAVEDYEEAKKLAIDLKKQKEKEEIDECLILAEQILLADSTLNGGDYKKAQDLYLIAKKLSNEAGNIGKEYIEEQLSRTEGYLSIYDLLSIGEKKEESGNYKKAIKYYKKAREKASSLYDRDGKEEALQKQLSAEEALEKKEQAIADKKEKERAKREEEQKQKEEEKKAEEEKAKKEQEEQREIEQQQKLQEQKNAIEFENKGNDLLKEGEYESAITYYRVAKEIYIRLEFADLADSMNDKIEAAKLEQKVKEEK